MISWSTKRRFKLTFIVIIILGIVGFSLFKLFTYTTPTCSDKIKNGKEEGIDCGGNCSEVCIFKAVNINVLLAKAFPVVDNVYNILLLLENPNFSYKITTSYNLNIYNKDGVLIYKKSNEKIVLSPSEKRAIFIPSIQYEGDISKVFVTFNKTQSITKAELVSNPIKIISKKITKDSNQTQLSINLKNDSLSPIRKIEIITILADPNNTIVQVGKTYLDYLDQQSEQKVFLTWPQKITEQINIIDVYTKILK